MIVFIIESIVLCGLFTLAILAGIRGNPLKGIMSYPPAVRDRVAGLPQYRDALPKARQGHIAAKIISGFGFILVFAVVIWFSAPRAFLPAFGYALGLFTVVNLYDLIVLDWLWFCNSKKMRIPGTEDMDKAYRDKLFHLVGFCKGMVIGLVISAAAAGLVVAWLMAMSTARL
jgi:hypothetical protein